MTVWTESGLWAVCLTTMSYCKMLGAGAHFNEYDFNPYDKFHNCAEKIHPGALICLMMEVHLNFFSDAVELMIYFTGHCLCLET